MGQYATDLLNVSAQALGQDHRHQVILFSWVGIVVLVLGFARLATRFSRLESASDFLLMGRSIGFWLFFGAYTGAAIGGGSLAGFTGAGYTDGISTLWILLVSGFTVPLFAWLFGKAINLFGRQQNAFTLADFLVHRYGPELRRPVMIMSYLRPAFITGLQFLALGVLLRAGFGLDRLTGILTGAGIVLVYTLLSGQFSAVTSQWLQSLLQGLGLMIFIVLACALHGGPGEAMAAMEEHLPASFLNAWSADFSLMSVWIISMGLFYFVDPWLFQWAYMAKNPRTSRNALVAASVASPWGAVSFIGGMMLAAAVISGRLELPADIEPDLIYLTFIQDHTHVVLGALLMISFLMTVLSCASSFVMNGATILQSDLINPMLSEGYARRHPLLLGRLSVIVTVALAIMCALWVPFLVPLWIIGQSIAVSGLFWPVLAAWFWPRATRNGALAGVALGGLSSFGWALTAWHIEGSANALFKGLHASHVGMVVSLVFLVAVSLLGHHGQAEKPEATLWRHLRHDSQEVGP